MILLLPRLLGDLNFLDTIIHRVSRNNVALRSALWEMLDFLFFKSFLLVLTAFSFWQGGWALSYHPVEFRDFPDIF